MSWAMQQLGEVIDIVMGQAPASEDCNFEKRGVPFVKAGEFGSSRPVIREWTTNPLRMAKPSDVLLCVVGATCGKINLGEDCAIGRSVAAIRPNPSKLDQFFLHYFLMTLTDRLREGSTGAAQTVISKEMISSIEIPKTPLPEQQRIVGKLDAAFAALAEAQANVERNRANARELFESYLNGVFEGKGDGWVECKLGDICSAITKGTTPTTHGYTYQPEGINFIKVESVSEDHELLPHMFAHVSQECHTFLKRSQLQADDLLFSIAGALGRVAIVQKEHLPANTNQALAIVRLNHDAPVLHEYLMWLLSSDLVVKQTAGMAGGAAQQNLSLTQMKDLDIAYPAKAVQKKIIESLTHLKVESAKLETTYQQKLTELAGLKKAVLGAAFRGEL